MSLVYLEDPQNHINNSTFPNELLCFSSKGDEDSFEELIKNYDQDTTENRKKRNPKDKRKKNNSDTKMFDESIDVPQFPAKPTSELLNSPFSTSKVIKKISTFDGSKNFKESRINFPSVNTNYNATTQGEYIDIDPVQFNVVLFVDIQETSG